MDVVEVVEVVVVDVIVVVILAAPFFVIVALCVCFWALSVAKRDNARMHACFLLLKPPGPAGGRGLHT